MREEKIIIAEFKKRVEIQKIVGWPFLKVSIRVNMRQREAVAGYIAIMPWLLGFLIFTLGPILYSFVLIFMKWEVITPPEWFGLGNFQRLFTDRLVIKSLFNTIYYTFAAVPIQLAAALGVAVLLNRRIRGNNIYRALVYFPSQMPVAAASILWFFIFSPAYGLANNVLDWFNLPPQKWIWDSDLVKGCLVFMTLWGIGNIIIIFLAGLQGIPDSLIEAARIDGANTFQLFRYITLPLLSPTIFFNLIMGFIGSFQVFTNVFIMTNGGPGNASLMYVLYIYRNAFGNFRMGYASLLAWILFLIVMMITFIQFKVSKIWVFYEGENQR